MWVCGCVCKRMVCGCVSVCKAKDLLRGVSSRRAQKIVCMCVCVWCVSVSVCKAKAPAARCIEPVRAQLQLVLVCLCVCMCVIVWVCVCVQRKRTCWEVYRASARAGHRNTKSVASALKSSRASADAEKQTQLLNNRGKKLHRD